MEGNIMSNVNELILSKEAKAARNKYHKEWRDNNKDKVNANLARYWNKKSKEPIEEKSNESSKTSNG